MTLGDDPWKVVGVDFQNDGVAESLMKGEGAVDL